MYLNYCGLSKAMISSSVAKKIEDKDSSNPKIVSSLPKTKRKTFKILFMISDQCSVSIGEFLTKCSKLLCLLQHHCYEATQHCPLMMDHNPTDWQLLGPASHSQIFNALGSRCSQVNIHHFLLHYLLLSL